MAFAEVVGLRGDAVGDVAARYARQDVLHVRVIEAHHGQAVEGHAARELDERLFDLVVGAVVIEVLGIDVASTTADRRRETQERAVALVGLGHQQIPAPSRAFEPSAAILPPTTTVGIEPAPRAARWR